MRVLLIYCLRTGHISIESVAVVNDDAAEVWRSTLTPLAGALGMEIASLTADRPEDLAEYLKGEARKELDQ